MGNTTAALSGGEEETAGGQRTRSTWRRWIRRAAVASSGGLLSASVASAFYVAEQLTRASKAIPVDEYGFTPFEVGVEWEQVYIPTEGNGSLSGWWFSRPETTEVIVCCYGYRGRKADLLGIGSALWRHGYNVLLFDYRGYGEHAGTRITLGYREVEDALAAVRYARQRLPDGQAGVIGYSMGASVAIMAAAREPQIQVVVADSPFAAQRNPIDRRVRQAFRLGWYSKEVLFIADHLVHRLAGYRLRDVEPLREVGRLAPRPLLLIHGLDDAMISPDDSRSLFAAAGQPKELWLLDGVGHCGAYFRDRADYVERVCRFFDATLGPLVRARQGGHPAEPDAAPSPR